MATLEDDQFEELQNTLSDIHRWVEDVNQENNQFKKGWKFGRGKNGKRVDEFRDKLQQYISRSTCLVAHGIRLVTLFFKAVHISIDGHIR